MAPAFCRTAAGNMNAVRRRPVKKWEKERLFSDPVVLTVRVSSRPFIRTIAVR